MDTSDLQFVSILRKVRKKAKSRCYRCLPSSHGVVNWPIVCECINECFSLSFCLLIKIIYSTILDDTKH